MARLGLGPEWCCLLANDIDRKKVETYRANFGAKEVVCKDVYELKSADMPNSPMLAWASFPCQDLSLAGNRNGLAGERSGTFWGFWTAIHKLKVEGRAPPVLILENVCGTLTSNGGKDFREICRALSSFGYNFGSIVVDAIRFVPQSRPRLFIICVDDDISLPSSVLTTKSNQSWATAAVQDSFDGLPNDLKTKWRWWNLPEPKSRTANLSSLIENNGKSVEWHTPLETEKLLKMMSSTNCDKVNEASKSNCEVIGAVYKRTRIEGGRRVQRAEVRFDGVAGCLRTPGGGSSRQSILVVNGNAIRSRLLTVREAARLMGVPESYAIPKNYNDGYHVFGDGLAVPVVAFIREHLLNALAKCANKPGKTVSIAAE